MKPLLILLSLCCIFPPNKATAQQISGNDLYTTCTSDNSVMLGFCIGYIIGNLEGQNWGAFLFSKSAGEDLSTDEFNQAANRAFYHCVPSSASNEQLRDVVTSYLQNNPATRHESARYLTWQAYQEAFPCDEATK
ncbi:Rap1a/Tai family immunity protein [Aliishimia ponticola]|uniref:Rap1a/Tai family immunity protein n=1 Tax=Aliishimia ponticola TaxID=2499833 RepID=UPI00267A8308